MAICPPTPLGTPPTAEQQCEADYLLDACEQALDGGYLDPTENLSGPADQQRVEDAVNAFAEANPDAQFNSQAFLDALTCEAEYCAREEMAEGLCAGLPGCDTDADIADQEQFLLDTGISLGFAEDGQFHGEDDLSVSHVLLFLSRVQEQGSTQQQLCPSGWSGTYPNCVAPTPDCPSGWSGNHPNCVAPPSLCPPNCVAPVHVCPSGWTGIYPNCLAPIVEDPCPYGWGRLAQHIDQGVDDGCRPVSCSPLTRLPTGWCGQPPPPDAVQNLNLACSTPNSYGESTLTATWDDPADTTALNPVNYELEISTDDFPFGSGMVALATGASVGNPFTATALSEQEYWVHIQPRFNPPDQLPVTGQWSSASTACTGISISISNAAAVHEGDLLTFTVTLSEAPTWSGVSVFWSTIDGTATAGDDYTARSGTITFIPWRTTREIQVVTLTDDLDDEDNETLIVRLSSASGATIVDFDGTGIINNKVPVPFLR